MNHYWMHTGMGRATLLSREEIIEAADKFLKDMAFFEHKEDDLVAEFVMVMNAAFSTGKAGEDKGPSDDQVRHLIAVAYRLHLASKSGRV